MKNLDELVLELVDVLVNYYRLTGDDKSLNLAMEIVRLVKEFKKD